MSDDSDTDTHPPLRYVNEGQIASFARTCVQAACVYAVGRGWMEEDTTTLVVTVGAPIAVFVAITAWGLYKQSDWNILRRAANVPSVRKVLVADPDVADSVPDPKVATN